ncbi:hypothetical protein QK289_13115 [Exiguobacterium antarcticum]|uniref:Abortive infection protein-like C-terminal domain-containing protein n=1 Tax=Exiguobacterium antarcticum TaxID=132920 RepID=A0ABT6R4S5_9BACL|nr:hypothetical protein [Exiguobacterium antarcticum]MDI3235950.1 hypothetical protein [Exiguobacterium antarcticum]
MNEDFFGPELFSERLNPIVHEVYVYDQISEKARMQIYHQIQRLLPRDFFDTKAMNMFQEILNYLTFRYGVINESKLISTPYYDLFKGEALTEPEKKAFFLLLRSSKSDFLLTLDLIELISRHVSIFYDETVSENLNTAFNEIFRKNGIGYEIINGTLISKDNEVVHSEIVKPSLQYLSQPEYAGANEELLQAFSDFKEGQFKNAIINANKAFESTLKIIIEKNEWQPIKFIPRAKRKPNTESPKTELEKAVASDLIETLTQNIKTESFQRNALMGMSNTLQSLASLRNTVGHGQGAVVSEVDIRRCEFAIHTAATNILFLVRTYG